MYKILSIVFIFALFSRSEAQDSADSLKNRILSPAQQQADFNYLRRLLQETHPGLYRYTPKAEMQKKLDSIGLALNRPMQFYDFYKVLCSLMADIRCAHTAALPRSDFNKYMNGIKIFPLFLYPVRNYSFVLFNGTADQTIKPGFELLSINGHRMDSISIVLKRNFWADGYIETSKEQVMQGSTFALFYYTLIERSETFHLVMKDLDGKEVSMTIPAQYLAFNENQYKRNPVNATTAKLYIKKSKNPWRLLFLNDPASTALLRLDAFGGKGMNNGDQARVGMATLMDKCMAKISERKSRHLIIDVRSNNGGWDTQGVELLKYLVRSDADFLYYRRQHAISDSSEFLKFSDLSPEDIRNVKKELRMESDGTFSMREEANPDLKLQTPKPNRFKGKIYVLMNGRSASTASEFLAVAHSNHIGTFIGEESGGAYEGGNGASFINLDLPQSGIQIRTPLIYYDNAVNLPEQKGRGVLPDHEIFVQSHDIFGGSDPQLEFVKELIRKSETGQN